MDPTLESNTQPKDPTCRLADQGLLDRCQRGDTRACEELAQACLTRVRKTVHMCIGASQEADDIVQNSMSKIFLNLSGFRRESKLTTWIDRITVNSVREYFRRRPLVSLFPAGDWHDRRSAPESDNPDVTYEKKTAMDAIGAHLSSIRPKKRMALILSTAYGYSVSEIAEITGCTTETAKKRLQHGRKELLERMRRDPRLAGMTEARDV